MRARTASRPRRSAPRGDRLGLVTAGKSYADLRQALLDFGLDEARCARWACACCAWG
jgi:indolepyruvate ferredoxin oxidoreductase